MVKLDTLLKVPVVVITICSLLLMDSPFLNHATMGGGMDSPVHDNCTVRYSILVVILGKLSNSEGRAATKRNKIQQFSLRFLKTPEFYNTSYLIPPPFPR